MHGMLPVDQANKQLFEHEWGLMLHLGLPYANLMTFGVEISLA